MHTPDDRPLDRSTSSLNDPRPETPAAAAMRDALRDTTVRPEAMHPSALDAGSGSDHVDAPLAGSADTTSGDRRADGADGNPGDEIGEAVGGISGVLTGAAIGSLGGPIGTIIGGIAGAVSGWWAGRAISESAYQATHDDDFYRDQHAGAAAVASYDDVRPAYQLGHLAGRNPEYHGRTFDDVESDLRHGWTADVSARHGAWDQVRGYAREAFERSRATATVAPGLGGADATVAGGAASGSAATGGAAGTPTGGTATERSAAAPVTGALDVGAASRSREG